jgi:hypothetical protein
VAVGADSFYVEAVGECPESGAARSGFGGACEGGFEAGGYGAVEDHATLDADQVMVMSTEVFGEFETHDAVCGGDGTQRSCLDEG